MRNIPAKSGNGTPEEGVYKSQMSKDGQAKAMLPSETKT